MNSDFSIPRGGADSRIIRRGLHAQVIDTLGREIVDGVVAPDSILNVEQLCERFDVSRTVVRESLRSLESLGMVSARPQVGTRVNKPTLWDLLSPQIVLWRGEGNQYLQQMQEILELRLGVEVAAARLVVQRANDVKVDELRRSVDEMEVAAERGDHHAFLRADIAFHEILLRSSGNAVIAQFSGTVAAALHTRAGDLGHTLNDHTHESIENHRSLVDAVQARDIDAAEQRARQIVLTTLTEFEERSQAGLTGQNGQDG